MTPFARRRSQFGLGLLAAFSIMIAACGPSTSSPAASGDATSTPAGESPAPTDAAASCSDQPFVWADAGEPSTLDPAITGINWEFTVDRNVYDHLTTYDSADPSTILPALATEWSNDGQNTWTFKLRDGVTFHDGSPFSADDVKASIDRILKLGQGQAYLISSVGSVTVEDATTVQIETKSPDVFLAANLSHIEIVAKKDIDANAADDGQAWFSENMNGTGPYRFVSWDRGSQITLEINDDWWGTRPECPIETVIDKFVGDGATRARGLEGGEYDLAAFVALDEALRIGDQDGFTTVKDDNLWSWPAIYLNTALAPTDNDDFRKALVLAFDYQAMIDSSTGLAATPRGPVPDWVPGSPEKDLAEISTDLDAAKQALADSGLEGATLKCSVPAGFPEFDFAATVLQSSAQELGVTVEIAQSPFVQALEEIKSNQSNCFIVGNANISPTDITKFFDAHYVSTGFFNTTHFASPEFDGLVSDIRSTFDDADRYDLTKDAAQAIVDTHMIIWANRPQAVVPIPDHVTGYVMDPAEYINCRFYELSFYAK